MTGVDGQTLAVLHRGFDGAEEVNPVYRDSPGMIFEHPVTGLEPPQDQPWCCGGTDPYARMMRPVSSPSTQRR